MATGAPSRRAESPPDNVVNAEWIGLRDNPGFRGIVDFLGVELDRVGSTEVEVSRDSFRWAVDLDHRDCRDATADQMFANRIAGDRERNVRGNSRAIR